MGKSGNSRSRSSAAKKQGGGSQPRPWVAPPPLCEYVYRTMKKNFEDMIWTEPLTKPTWLFPVGDLHREHDFMRTIVIDTIAFGSEATKPLLPSCCTFLKALCWYRRASSNYRQNCGVMVRISTKKVGEQYFIDMSSKFAQDIFFHKGRLEYGEFVVNHGEWALPRSIENGEILIMWRGKVDLTAMDVVDVSKGEFVEPLLISLAQQYLTRGSTILGDILRPYFRDGRRQIEAYVKRRVTGIEPLSYSLGSSDHVPNIFPIIPNRPSLSGSSTDHVSHIRPIFPDRPTRPCPDPSSSNVPPLQPCSSQGDTKKVRIHAPSARKGITIAPKDVSHHGDTKRGIMPSPSLAKLPVVGHFDPAPRRSLVDIDARLSERRSPSPPPPFRPPPGLDEPLSTSSTWQTVHHQLEEARALQRIREVAATPIPEVAATPIPKAAAAERAAATPIPEVAATPIPKVAAAEPPQEPPIPEVAAAEVALKSEPLGFVVSRSDSVVQGNLAPTRSAISSGGSDTGSATHGQRPEVMKPLIERKADVNADHGSQASQDGGTGSQAPPGPANFPWSLLDLPGYQNPPGPPADSNDKAIDSKDEPIWDEGTIDFGEWPEEVEDDPEQVGEELCQMLRKKHFKREHKLLSSFTPDKVTLWKRVQELEEDFVMKSTQIQAETLTEFQNSDWRSNRPELTNPRKRGYDKERSLARTLDQEELRKLSRPCSRKCQGSIWIIIRT